MKTERTIGFAKDITQEEEVIIKTARAFARSQHQYVIITRQNTRDIIFASGNFEFLCGMSADDICNNRENFYKKSIIREDLEFLKEIQERCEGFVHNMPHDSGMDCALHCDLHIKGKRGTRLIHAIFTRIDWDDTKTSRYTLCSFNISSGKAFGRTIIKTGTNVIYEYKQGKWKEERLYALKSTERDMLLLTTQGLTVSQIATALCKSEEAIKSCRKLLYKRLGVKNTAEAMSFVVNFQLL